MTTFHVLSGADPTVTHPGIRKIGIADVFDALRLGLDDFREKPSHYVFLCLIYPIAGVVLMTWSAGANMLPLLYPLASGFALIGPVAAIALYEVSRRRELGMDARWPHVMRLHRHPAIPSILAVAAILFVIFVVWLLVAQGLYTTMFGPTPPATISEFWNNVIGTEQGWNLILVGNLVGFVFAVVVLSISVVTFPLLLDRDVGALTAVETSIRATLANPVPVALWGLIIAAGLVIGSIPIFVGLAVVMPILGHATWHLYRKLVVPPGTAR
ncbi:DUF2189 domain-containing protein [Sinorhizobium medicae]|uniref:DUF2189 domain-containing protein n=1 Tax=Sinorhizobium medicae TaxID=110321 RepID=UPI000C7970E0|nr:DUF2189 domain-containing protein [Sinorhizobium medicae]MDX0449927.1 DUF2189 domain-containing protein [Sinorhizobium medicae]MDX0554069.1 DUF2189 domain-containing protein [Sinorhizobium medicae]MDX0564229.1 DUF2189 domain-containing protein [Sinorhizobium medicae]MDX0576728.1 DUF2189 domain-containing protein [Sinorhizobium medicae]MDX0702922.1 DUF2189 domain-containing protein [Sinorhizobium medicae]